MEKDSYVTIRRSAGHTSTVQILKHDDTDVIVGWREEETYKVKKISKKEILELNPQYTGEVITFQFSQEQIDAFQGCPDCPQIFLDAITN
jgi:hypothetical protein